MAKPLCDCYQPDSFEYEWPNVYLRKAMFQSEGADCARCRGFRNITVGYEKKD